MNEIFLGGILAGLVEGWLAGGAKVPSVVWAIFMSAGTNGTVSALNANIAFVGAVAGAVGTE